MIDLLWQDTRIKRLRLMVPKSGCWIAEATFDKPIELQERSTLRVGGVSLAGALLTDSSSTYLTATRARIIGGAGGWRKNVAARHYHNDAGISKRNVISTTAAEAGETMGDLGSLGRLLENDWTRVAGRASAILDALAPGWWVDFYGVTQVTPRPGGEVPESVEVKAFDPLSSVAELRVNEITDIAPGMTIIARFSAPRLVNALEFDFADVARVGAWLV